MKLSWWKPLTGGSKILVCPPSNKVMNMLWNQPEAEVWTANLVEHISKDIN